MPQSNKGCEKEEVLERELTEADLANIFGGTQGTQSTPQIVGMPDLSSMQLPDGLSLPSLADISKLAASSSSKNKTPAGKGATHGGSSMPNLGNLLAALPLPLPSLGK